MVNVSQLTGRAEVEHRRKKKEEEEEEVIKFEGEEEDVEDSHSVSSNWS